MCTRSQDVVASAVPAIIDDTALLILIGLASLTCCVIIANKASCGVLLHTATLATAGGQLHAYAHAPA